MVMNKSVVVVISNGSCWLVTCQCSSSSTSLSFWEVCLHKTTSQNFALITDFFICWKFCIYKQPCWWPMSWCDTILFFTYSLDLSVWDCKIMMAFKCFLVPSACQILVWIMYVGSMDHLKHAGQGVPQHWSMNWWFMVWAVPPHYAHSPNVIVVFMGRLSCKWIAQCGIRYIWI